MLQHILKESGNTLKVITACPGLTKENLLISFDKKNGILDIKSKIDEEQEELTLGFDIELEGSITIPAKFRSDEVDANVENGILIVTFGLAENINVIKFK